MSNRVVKLLLLSALVLPMGDQLKAQEDVAVSAERLRSRMRPIVFVIGCPRPPTTHADLVAKWETMRSRFLDAGYPGEYLNVWSQPDPLCGSATIASEALGDFIREIRRKFRKQVDLVTHSQGALKARWYIKENYGLHIRKVVFLAPGHHGTEFAQIVLGVPSPTYDGGKELFPPYACEGQSLNDVQFKLNGCLTATGRTVYRDETPFGRRIDYLNIYIDNDQVIIPMEAACLNQAHQNDCSDPVNVPVTMGGVDPHDQILQDEGVFSLILLHLLHR
jgi:triacylglycerol esterase/lipase EstA (alpha/beta hydrolase family)